ncbi:hypothetical protein V8B97DRAFT_956891 [Scleroderma yunnanense]
MTRFVFFIPALAHQKGMAVFGLRDGWSSFPRLVARCYMHTKAPPRSHPLLNTFSEHSCSGLICWQGRQVISFRGCGAPPQLQHSYLTDDSSIPIIVYTQHGTLFTSSCHPRSTRLDLRFSGYPRLAIRPPVDLAFTSRCQQWTALHATCRLTDRLKHFKGTPITLARAFSAVLLLNFFHASVFPHLDALTLTLSPFHFIFSSTSHIPFSRSFIYHPPNLRPCSRIAPPPVPLAQTRVGSDAGCPVARPRATTLSIRSHVPTPSPVMKNVTNHSNDECWTNCTTFFFNFRNDEITLVLTRMIRWFFS